MEKNALKRSYITEKELVEVFQEQYNDIFSEILKTDQFNFFKVLMKQVITYLDIVKKYSPQTLLKKVEKNFVKKYLEEKEIISKDYELIKNKPKMQLDYLDKLNCIIHCPKCKDALHTCGFKFVVYGNYVYCLTCTKVYNEQKVDMFCDECDIEYYTKLREIINYDLESYYLISISNYHCKIENEEKIKCPKCEKDLYVDIYNMNNYGKIEEATCIYCNLNFNLNLFNFKCKQCGKYFKGEAKIYNEFYNKKNDLICKVHTLFNKKNAGPESLLNKTCECNLNNITKYRHSDGGILLDGERNGQKIVLCDKCYNIFDYYEYIFTCPLCNKKFNSNKEHYYEYNSIIEGSVFSNKDLRFNKRNSTFVETNVLKRKNACLSNEHHSNKEVYYGKCECSSSNKNKKSKNIITSQFDSKNKVKDSSKTKNISSKDVSKSFRDCEKNILKNRFNNNNKDNNENQNQNININIQNFYNNYAPIIHIIETNPKKIDTNNEPNYILKTNYKLINASPKKKKRLII